MTSPSSPDIKTAEEIENLILAETDFSKQLDIYTSNYSLVKNLGRLTTKGPKDIKFFCQCNTCSNEGSYEEKLVIYNMYFLPELRKVIDKIKGFSDYKDKLRFYDVYFDINGTQVFEGLNVTLSVRPTNSSENKVYNEFQYDRFLERYFQSSSVSMNNYYQRDFKSLRKLFNAKKLNATYPEQAASKEIALLNEYFEQHRDEKTRDLYQQLNDGATLDFSHEEWQFQQYLVIIEANEGMKFLRYLENLKQAATSYTQAFHEVVQQSDEAYESYSVVTWNLINRCIQEMKDKLYVLSNDDSRVAYLKTTLLSFKIPGFEDYFKEVEDFLGNDIKVNQGFEATRNVMSITADEKNTPLYEGVASVIKGRDCIVLEISEHVADVYPHIDFFKLMEVVDYRTRGTFWIGSPRLANKNTTGFLHQFPDAEKLYNSGVEKIEKGVYERNALDDLRLSLELLLKAILGNAKSLENQRAAITELFKNKQVSPQLANMFWTLIEQYSKYQNENVKHNDKIQVKEINFVLDLTNSFMKHLVQII
ncbi:hypothetical protein [Sphingobacterium bovistauri]|uniref:Uncharacterized protein n=1 Tax=Sphingobacterium bovistauri TaxID=2781959 RepID=A0ABS7Z654_9SPHI|nr:hypothetical protein [Sphingobacterium bovistauri]MCA5005668.1 hypothetical protein [Sphingobacterium bovistauri]